ncbi:E3 ubiquitin-protein ligase TRIM39-like [Dendropsophus ebraccatus]|uniref:E3 ubiquitin-protein ligase TRIM39-like n=1 Tax=Dendropsophus ebraccatus TaxID=150705 RepID=UPI0038319C21
MASVDVRDELLCPICLSTFTDPVILRCGHNFCRGCIDEFLNTQDGSGVYSCPECREKFRRRPALIRNIALQNVAGHFMEETPVVKCSIHKKILEYYCPEDAACICATCLDTGHRQHQVEKLEEASEKKKKKLRNVLRKLNTKREKTEEKVQSVEEHWKKALDKASAENERITALFTDIRRRLDNLEKRILRDISRQEEQLSLSLSDVIQQLEMKKDELSRKMRHIEELCNMVDPLTVLQDPDTGDLCDPENREGDEDTGGHDKTHDVDVDVITGILHAGFSRIVTYLQTITSAKPKAMRPTPSGAQSLPIDTQASQYTGTGVIVRAGGDGAAAEKGPADILLDVNTAGNNLLISGDLKTATMTRLWQNRPKTAERFEASFQVMSRRGFFSGRHYWDVEIGRSEGWSVGMCYPSIERIGENSLIGDNNKSWGVEGRSEHYSEYTVIHDRKWVHLPYRISSDRVRICLDYEAGLLSFYELCDPIRHLHTFTATFTEPLYAGIGVYNGSIEILGGD